jgi:hypothetical protein
MAMAVRKGDEPLKQRLDHVIAEHKAAIDAILRRFDVRLYPNAGDSL